MPRKSSNSTLTSDRPIPVGLDIGYGITKALTPGRDPVLFPSVAGHGRKIKFRADELATRYPGDQVANDEGNWFIGELALSQLLPGELLRLRGRTADSDSMGNEFRRRMLTAALGKLFANVTDGAAIHVRLATGLPVDHMPRADVLKAALIGQHAIKTDTADFVANVTEVMVMLQPYGCLYAQKLTPAGRVNPCYTATRSGIADIGTYTTDVTLDHDGEYIDALSGSIELGISDAQERIGALLESEYGEKQPYRAIENTLKTGCFRERGKVVDFSEAVANALEPLRSSVINLISEKWKVGVGIDVIYVAGGGAPLLIDQIKSAYPQAELVADPQIANARGYLNYALMTGRNPV
ncbi:MAG: ParM/StbA family protein [Aggregatilineales bacterium]